MAKEIETEVRLLAPKLLTPTAYLLLLFLADSAWAEDRIVCLSNDRVIRDTRSSLSAIKVAYTQLADLNIVVPVDDIDIPDRVRHYKARIRRINPTSEWLTIYNRVTDSDDWPGVGRGPESGPGQKQAPEGARNRPGRGPESDPNQITTNQELENKNKKTSSSTSGSAGRARKAAKSDEGLDPAESLSDTSPTLTPSRRQPPPDSGMGLARYLEHRLATTESGRKALTIPDPINYTALAGVLNRWMRDGMTPDHIRILIDLYCADKKSLTGLPPWKDFLARRARLTSAAEAATLHNTLDDHLSPQSLAYWGVDAQDVALYPTPDPENPSETDRPRSH